MFRFDDSNIKWLFLLLGSITFSVLGVLFPNWFKELHKPRSHNSLQLLNECLARHQLAYFTYFFALAIAASFNPQHGWIKNLVWTAMGFSLGFYGYGLFSSVIQERKLKAHHGCAADSGCTTLLPFSFGLRLCRLNILFAIMSLAAGVSFALLVT